MSIIESENLKQQKERMSKNGYVFLTTVHDRDKQQELLGNSERLYGVPNVMTVSVFYDEVGRPVEDTRAIYVTKCSFDKAQRK